MSSEPAEVVAHDDAFDPHRFNAEPKRKANKFILIVIAGFIGAMGILGATGYLVKNQLSNFWAERDHKAEQERERKKAEEGDGRKGKVFGSASKTAPAALPAATSATLPTGFNEVKPVTAPTGNAEAIPVLRNGSPAGGAVPAGSGGNGGSPRPPKPRPTMMLDDGSGNGNANGSGHNANGGGAPEGGGTGGAGFAAAGGAPGGALASQPRPRNVQQLAAQQAEKTPLSATSQASAANLGNRSYLLARGAFLPCVLETQLVSNIGGIASCIVSQNIFSDDGKVMLVEKGSKVIGQYQSSVKPGDNRIAVLWQRIKTPTGVVIDVDSPAADGVGSMGAPGYIDNHWPERIGAAFLLSIVDDAVKIEVAKQSRASPDAAPTGTTSTTSKLAEKVLDSTINIPPTLYKNRGERLMVYVNRDLWFDTVYNLNQR